MFGGKYLNNWRMAELHAKEAPDRVRELEQWGGVFDRTPDRTDVAAGVRRPHATGGSSTSATAPGLELIRTLQDKAVHAGHRCLHGVHDHAAAEGRRPRLRVPSATGAPPGEFVRLRARRRWSSPPAAPGKCWRITSNSWECTGDGHALAYEAGAELIDMEFVQFHPTGMVWPPGVIGLLVTEAVRGEGGILRNASGERFMERYDPKRLELSTRDVVARAIYTEVKEGRGTPHGGVFLDVSHLPAATVRQQAAEHVRPVHGARRRRHHAGADGGRADVPLLHGRHPRRRRDRAQSRCPASSRRASARAACTARNRLGGNSLSDLLVFGRRAGECRGRARARRAGAGTVDDAELAAAAAELDALPSGPGDEDPYRAARRAAAS